MLSQIPPNAFELTLEQQFELRSIVDAIDRMDIDQLRGLTKQLVSIEMVQKNLIRSFVRQAIDRDCSVVNKEQKDGF